MPFHLAPAVSVPPTELLVMPLTSPSVQTGAAFSGLLVFDFTVFALSTYRSIKLGRHNEPFLNRLFVDGTFVIRILYKELTPQDNVGFVYYGYAVALCAETHLLRCLLV